MQSRLLRHDQIRSNWQPLVRKAGQSATAKWQFCLLRRGSEPVERTVDEKVKNRSAPHGKPKIIQSEMQLIDAFSQCQVLDGLSRAGSFHEEAISNLASAAHLKKQGCFADCAKHRQHHQIGAGLGDEAHLSISPGVKAIDANHQLCVKQLLAHCLNIASLMIREKKSFA